MTKTIPCNSCSLGLYPTNSKVALAIAPANIDDVPNPEPLGTFLTFEFMVKPEPSRVNISSRFPPFCGKIPQAIRHALGIAKGSYGLPVSCNFLIVLNSALAFKSSEINTIFFLGFFQ